VIRAGDARCSRPRQESNQRWLPSVVALISTISITNRPPFEEKHVLCATARREDRRLFGSYYFTITQMSVHPRDRCFTRQQPAASTGISAMRNNTLARVRIGAYARNYTRLCNVHALVRTGAAMTAAICNARESGSMRNRSPTPYSLAYRTIMLLISGVNAAGAGD